RHQRRGTRHRRTGATRHPDLRPLPQPEHDPGPGGVRHLRRPGRDRRSPGPARRHRGGRRRRRDRGAAGARRTGRPVRPAGTGERQGRPPAHVRAARLGPGRLGPMNAPSPSLPPVGFAGVGNIGAPMASCLLRAGYPLRVLDPRPAAVAPLRDAGATVADQVADLAACQVVALAVPDDAAVEQVLVGDGLLDLLPPGATVLVHSTILPQTARELAGRAAAAGRVAVLDAPVSGGAERAAAGTLAVMVGGPAEALERVRPVLETLAAEVVHAGPAGAGAAVKLANQLAMFAA